jgi:hypothetical protein
MPANASERCEIGRDVDLPVEEVHFGNPRVRIGGEPAPMPQMLKWPAEKFDELCIDCAQIDFGDFRAWSAIGIKSNRILYAMKRCNVVTVKAVVVAPPEHAADEDADLTYGASCQGIQLVP